MIELSRADEVFVLRFDSGENRFGRLFVRELNQALDEVEACAGPKALVTTGSGKFFSNGLDLEEMQREVGGAGVDGYLRDILMTMARVLTFPAATVAAVNGHAFGAGAQLAVAHDHRLMRVDRGFWCMPEIDMHAPLHPGMLKLLAARIPAAALHELITTGKRYGGAEAQARGIMDEAVAEAELLPRAIHIAAGLAAKSHPVLGTLKRSLYPEVLKALAGPMGLPD